MDVTVLVLFVLFFFLTIFFCKPPFKNPQHRTTARVVLIVILILSVDFGVFVSERRKKSAAEFNSFQKEFYADICKDMLGDSTYGREIAGVGKTGVVYEHYCYFDGDKYPVSLFLNDSEDILTDK